MRQIYQARVHQKLEKSIRSMAQSLEDNMHLRVLGTVWRAAPLRIVSAFKDGGDFDTGNRMP